MTGSSDVEWGPKRVELVKSFMNGSRHDRRAIGPEFVRAIGPGKVELIVRYILLRIGKVKEVQEDNGELIMVGSRGFATAEASVDGGGNIRRLRVSDFRKQR